MLFASLLLALVSMAASADAFATLTSSAPPKVLHLIPPRDISDVTEHAQEIYDANVQKTYGRFSLTIDRGDGCKLYDNTGREFLDCVAGIATCALGHSNSYLNEAIAKQMETLHHVSNLYLIPPQAALAEWLTSNSVAEKVFFCNSGAEANEAAIKCARRHASNRGIVKPIVVSAHQSFHGRTLGSLSATGQQKYHKGFGYDGKMVPGFEYVTYNDVDDLKRVVQEIKNQEGCGLAAIMMEALQGEGGIVPGKADFFQEVRSICDQEDALMICDEVQIGMGRSGKLWGYEQLGVSPDIFTSAKALGGGVPIGAMMAGPRAADVFGPGDHASTYGGNPLACAAGLAVAQYFCDFNVLDNVVARSAQLMEGLADIAKKHPGVLKSTPRGWGLLVGIETANDNIAPGSIVSAALEQDLLILSAGKNVIRFVPPLIISEEEIATALEKFETAVANVEASVLVEQ